MPPKVEDPVPPKLRSSFLVRSREQRIALQIKTRREELEKAIPELSGPQALKAKIELKRLNLLSVQKEARKKLSSEMQEISKERVAAENLRYKRNNRSRYDSHIRFLLERSERTSERERVLERHKHREFAKHVAEHAKVFKDFHLNALSQAKKVNRGAAQVHANVVRREQQSKERAERERLKALRDNDEDAYLALLQETKNERLTMLLAQTDEYLRNIGALVAQLQQEEEEEEERLRKSLEEAAEGKEGAADVDGDGDGEDEATTTLSTTTKEDDSQAPAGDSATDQSHSKDDESQASTKKPRNKTYYTMAHRVEEKITEQPKCLVGGTLKPYQMVGLNWLVSLYNNNLNGVLADEMGLGKTIQTISLLCHLREKKNNMGPFMVVVPLSVLSNWKNELARWAPSMKVVCYKGSPKKRREIYAEQVSSMEFNVLITSYEFIMRDKSSLSKIRWNYIIIDEGHRMKNHACKLAQTFGKYYVSRHRLLLTGTPLQNSLPELWSLLNFLLPTIFNSVANFEEWFSAPFQSAGETVAMTEEESLLVIRRLHKVLRPFLLRRLKKDVEHQLPDKIEKNIRCGFSAMQRVMYRQMKETGSVPVQDTRTKQAHKKGLMNTIMQLRKICNHPYLFMNEWTIDENLVRVAGKLELLDRLLPKFKATGHRVLMFTQMTALITLMEDYFAFRGHRYLRLDGHTKSDDRGALLKEFNQKDSPYFIFILSTRAGGLGLNLQTADTVILFDSDWNPHVDLQAQDRAHRIGQKNKVLVLRLTTVNSVEEHILERANFKKDLDDKIIEAGMFNKNSTKNERKQMLEEILSRDRNEGKSKRLPTDAELNHLIARSPDELEVFGRMDEEREEQYRSLWGHMEHPPGRLMEDHELPLWMTTALVESPKDVKDYGRGHRERAKVDYSDGLTDHQWDQVFEGEDDMEELKERNNARRSAKRKAASGIPEVAMDHDEHQSDGGDDDDSGIAKEDITDVDVEDEREKLPTIKIPIRNTRRKSRRVSTSEATMETPTNAKKRGKTNGRRASGRTRESKRRRTAASPKTKPTRSSTKSNRRGASTPTPVGRLGADALVLPRSLSRRDARLIREALRRAETCTDPSTGRLRSALFLELPSAELYPDYYDIIKEPVALDTIRNRIEEGTISDITQLKACFSTMVQNAKTYNLPGSIVIEDALALQGEFLAALGDV